VTDNSQPEGGRPIAIRGLSTIDSHVLVSFDGRAQVVLHYHYSSYGQDENTHPGPVSSPDGTKVMYNSDMLRKGRIKRESTGNSDVWLVVVRRPSPPRELAARMEQSGIRLTWKPPLHAEREIYWNPGNLAREIKSYCVLRADRSGGPYAPAHDGLVVGTQFDDPTIQPGANRYYVVQAIEHSGLASLFSPEACATPTGAGWQGDVCHYYEAEDGRLQRPVVPQMDWHGTSGGWYLAAAAAQPDPHDPLEPLPGKAILTLHVPKPTDYVLWLRARRLLNEPTTGGRVSVSLGGTSSDVEVSRERWAWYRTSRTFRLAAGDTEAIFSLPDASVGLDMICLTDRDSFIPQGLGAWNTDSPARPTAVTVEKTNATTRIIRWTASPSRCLSHYNVYCGRDTAYPLNNQRLLFSPTGTQAVDWGIPEGTITVYKVTAVDRFGNESEPAVAAEQ
jgi:hypothetical protein